MGVLAALLPLFGVLYGISEALDGLGFPAASLTSVVAYSVFGCLVSGLGWSWRLSSLDRVSDPGPMRPYAGLTPISDTSEPGPRQT